MRGVVLIAAAILCGRLCVALVPDASWQSGPHGHLPFQDQAGTPPLVIASIAPHQKLLLRRLPVPGASDMEEDREGESARPAIIRLLPPPADAIGQGPVAPDPSQSPASSHSEVDLQPPAVTESAAAEASEPKDETGSETRGETDRPDPPQLLPAVMDQDQANASEAERDGGDRRVPPREPLAAPQSQESLTPHQTGNLAPHVLSEEPSPPAEDLEMYEAPAPEVIKTPPTDLPRLDDPELPSRPPVSTEQLDRNSAPAVPSSPPTPAADGLSDGRVSQDGEVIEPPQTEIPSPEPPPAPPQSPPVVNATEVPGQQAKAGWQGGQSEALERESLAWWHQQIISPLLPARSPEEIGLDELIFLALRESPEIQVVAQQPLIEETRIGEADAAFDWTSFLESRWDDLNDPVGDDLQTGGPSRFRDEHWLSRGGVRRRNRAGGEFQIGQELGFRDTNSRFFNPPNQGLSRLRLSYSHPLLRGRGVEVNESRIVIAHLRTEAAEHQFLANLQNVLLDIIQAYWNLYRQRGLLLQRQRLLQQTECVLNELELRGDIDATRDQITRAAAAAAVRRAEVLRARVAVVDAQEQLLRLVLGPDFEQYGGSEIIPIDPPAPAEQAVSLQNQVTTALQWRPEMDVALAEIKAASVRQNVARNQLLPLLNVLLETYAAGLRGNSDIGGAWIDQFGVGDPGYSVGLQMEYPLGRRAASKAYERSLLELRQLQQRFRQAAGDIVLEVRTAVREVDRLTREIDLRRQAVAKARDELPYVVARRRALLDHSKTASLYLEDLLASQLRLADAEANLLQAETDYMVARMNLKRAVGVLLRHEPLAAEGAGGFELQNTPADEFQAGN